MLDVVVARRPTMLIFVFFCVVLAFDYKIAGLECHFDLNQNLFFYNVGQEKNE